MTADLVYLVAGGALLLAVVLPQLLRHWAVSAPMVLVVVGMLIGLTPLPDGNIADRYDRWDLITQDTLPAYQELLAEDPDRLRELVGSDFDGRVDDYRLLERAPGILFDLATDWQYRR